MDITDEFLIEIGKQISYLREKNNQTLDDLEYLSGIDSSDINKYEKGKTNLTIRNLIRISKALNVHPKILLDFDFDLNKYNNE
ncbi:MULTISPECIES: helix-turn-helix domain-containing protein [unclassified Empedobacter]|uniref:helix-turn-helix domain-containing protein n=2 Tax=Empedobacter TaxID=59734 RepID=UPI00244B0E41|nr:MULTISPECIES: helix-turn-helix transcriptional regulator [unclassified Empedobacter]MDH2208470.1 helix-turn-helix domain-containing protein [Empedobacter sp. GD03644]